MAVQDAASSYQVDLSTLSRQTVAELLRMWSQVDLTAITKSWQTQLPQASALVVGAQTVAAEMADPYLSTVLGGNQTHVNAEGLAGRTPFGDPVSSLLLLPAIEAERDIGDGASLEGALKLLRAKLAMYTHTTVADAGRLAVTTGMAARPHISGYYRRLRLPSCARCAILAGKFYRYNTGFRRHPKCDCTHEPVEDSDDSLEFDARDAILSGQVHGISRKVLESIRLGADPSQVINAGSGMYMAGGRRFTTAGTTRRGVAGARIIARDVERALGRDVAGETFRNFTFDRYEAGRYAELFRRGKTYTRLTKTGRVQNYAYQYAQTPRPTPELIVASASSRDEAIRLLTNYGYIL